MANLGLGLQGFSAGVAGQLPQFNAQLERGALRDKQLSDERRQEQLLANRVALEGLESGNNDLVLTDLNNRLFSLNERGANTDFTANMVELIGMGTPDSLAEAKRIMGAADREAVIRGLLPKIETEKPAQTVLAKDSILIEDGETIASNIQTEKEVTAPIPAALLAGLELDVAARGSAAFDAAGGGSAGVTAFNQQVSMGAQEQLRADVPLLLSASFPNATDAERSQLDAAVSGANSVEAGMQAATKIREEQRRLKKVQGVQNRGIFILERILSEGSELNNVIGALEGRSPLTGLLDAQETDTIADIEELSNILTGDNLKMMTGVLSESDMAIIRSIAGGALDRRRSEESFRIDASTLLSTLKSSLIETIDDVAGTPDLTQLSDEELAEMQRAAQ